MSVHMGVTAPDLAAPPTEEGIRLRAWPAGRRAGEVIFGLDISDEQARRSHPQGWREGKPYPHCVPDPGDPARS